MLVDAELHLPRVITILCGDSYLKRDAGQKQVKRLGLAIRISVDAAKTIIITKYDARFSGRKEL